MFIFFGGVDQAIVLTYSGRRMAERRDVRIIERRNVRMGEVLR